MSIPDFDRHSILSGHNNLFSVRQRIVHLLEFEDVLFHHNSAVLLVGGTRSDQQGTSGQEEITGLDVLKECYLFVESNPQKEMLIVGNTDTSGRPRYNLELSRLRAQNVLYALKGMRQAWVGVTMQKYKVEDYQQILKWFSATLGWNCDPGDVDNDLGPNTRNAIGNFQSTYNSIFPVTRGSSPIDVDKRVGRQTWGAIFDVYMMLLEQKLGVDTLGLESYRLKLKFIGISRQFVGCGENWPIEAPEMDKFRSQTNRRVEIRFFDPQDKPPLLCHPDDESCSPSLCRLFGNFYVVRYIPVNPGTPPYKQWIVRILQGGPGPLNVRQPVANETCVVTGSGASEPEIRTNTDENGFLRVNVSDETPTMRLKIERLGAEVTLNGGSLPEIDTGDDAVKHRLYNLGYGKDKFDQWDQNTFSEALREFQNEQGLPVTGATDDATKNKLKELHGS